MISFIFGIVSFCIPKFAVAALLNRVLNPNFLQRVIMWTLVSLVGAIGVVNILIYVTMCDPPPGLWKPMMVMTGQAKCRDIWILINFATFNGGTSHVLDTKLTTLLTSTPAFSAFVDLYLAIYPGFVLFSLQMSIRKKIALTAALGLGAVYVHPLPLTVAEDEADQTDSSAAATAMVKCAQLKGLADQTDSTCESHLIVFPAINQEP